MKYLYILIASLSLYACASVPELKTFEERALAAEITLTRTVQQVIAWRQDGRLSDKNWEAAKQAALETAQLMDAVYVAKGLGDMAKAESGLVAANAGINLLIKILKTQEEVNK
jgi:hypothetical protein